MSQKKWRGTILFTIIVVVMGGTIGLKLYGLGETQTATTAAVAGRTSAGASTGTGSSGTTGTSTTPSPSSSATSTPATAPASATRVVTGSTVDTRYGPIQLQVTFSGTTITAITALQTPDQDGRSVSINEQAVPILTQEALASQSASIDTVSGATYTSEGYMRSLQSAIDQR
ncbi:FMN-binding protein [Leifsonia sp. NCR5]|uniref:FMN-binding protein n=1 Tax=Leifsonia sp. NCR5 TaxID=1978342 RepID=UPI000A18FC80|nr:FMN-binding protein [Leifsonia sp. NCR5]